MALIIKYQHNEWSVLEYAYYRGHECVDSINVKSKSYPVYIDSILSILTADASLNLPSQAAIPGFRHRIADGQFIMLEFATKKFYKALLYHCPEDYISEPNNKQFFKLIMLLDNYFHFYLPRCKAA